MRTQLSLFPSAAGSDVALPEHRQNDALVWMRSMLQDASVYRITPMGKPRMTQRDRWKKRPVVLRYREFCDQARSLGITLLPSGSHVVFVLPMPASWSKRRKAEMNCQPHQGKPDVDNMIKALMDAIFGEDQHIWDVRISKVWGYKGAILIRRI